MGTVEFTTTSSTTFTDRQWPEFALFLLITNSHPWQDFTYVCPTEIIAFSDRADDFARVNCSVIAVSTDTEEVHLAWINTPRKNGGLGHMKIPIVADTTKVG